MATFSISAVARKAQATANGSTTQFAFSFSVNTEADVAVFVGTTLKTISTHYTVSITSSTGAGSITFTSGNTPTNGQIVTIMSKTALARSSVYTSGGTINATSLETDFDTNMMLFQQQDERLDRTLIAPVDDATSIDMTLPNKDARKGKSLGFDGTSGNPTAIEQVTGAAVNVSTVSVGGSATASVAVSGGTATFALGIPTGATGATGDTGAAGGGMAELSSDSSPQLGGPLDVVTHDIVTTSNRDIELAPNGTGKTVLKGNTNPGTIVLNCESNSHGQTIKAQPHSAGVTNTLTLPAGGNQTLVGTAGATFTGDVTIPAGDLILGSTAVTSTGAEINTLDALSRGSLIYGNASAATAILTKGGAGTVLTSDGTDISWAAAAGGGGLEFISSTDVSNAATASFTGFDASKYDSYIFTLGNILPQTDDQLFQALLSVDDGSNYLSASDSYVKGVDAAASAGDAAYIPLAYRGIGSAANEGLSGEYSLICPHLNTATYVTGFALHTRANAALGGLIGNGYALGKTKAATIVDGIQFKFASGNIVSGTITMYGRVNS